MDEYYDWNNPSQVTRKSYVCGYCGNKVGPDHGYSAKTTRGGSSGLEIVHIYICPSCTKPTFIDENGNATPSPALGRDVAGITDVGVQSL